MDKTKAEENIKKILTRNYTVTLFGAIFLATLTSLFLYSQRDIFSVGYDSGDILVFAVTVGFLIFTILGMIAAIYSLIQASRKNLPIFKALQKEDGLEIVWIYPRKYKKLFITVERSIIVGFSDGNTEEIYPSRKQFDEVVNFLIKTAPYATRGFNYQHLEPFRKHPKSLLKKSNKPKSIEEAREEFSKGDYSY